MSVNKVILLGNVGRDPEIRYIESNVAVANFSIATTERGFTSRTGQVIADRTEWHNIVAWRGLAQIVEKYVKKGTPLYIEGKIRTRSYDDKDGVKRYTTEIFADNIELLGRKADSSAPNSDNSTPISQTPYQTPEYTGNQDFNNSGQSGYTPNLDLLGETTDDLPF